MGKDILRTSRNVVTLVGYLASLGAKMRLESQRALFS